LIVKQFIRVWSRTVPHLRGGLAVGLLAGLVLPNAAMAQSSADDGDGSGQIIEEIVVTARNTEESLQDVPVAVTAITSETLDVFRIDEPVDLISRVPALSVSVGGSGASAQINLRGVGSSSISNAFDSAVALNFDGISVSTQRLLQSAFFDVEQVSVLKGPQSLFFGKAASAGVLALQSAEPTDDWEYGGKTSYEFEENGATVGGFISGPLSDRLGFRLAAEYQDIDRFVQIDSIVPTADPNRGLSNLIARATFDWNPTDAVNANLKLNYNRQRSETLNSRLDFFCGANGVPEGSGLAIPGIFMLPPTPGVGLFEPTHDCDLNDNRFAGVDGSALINVVPTGSPGDDVDDISLAFNDTDIFFGRVKVDAALNESFDLTVLVGYVDLDNEYNDTFNTTGQNPDGTPAGLVAPFRNTLEQITTEVRLLSNFDGPFNFQIGGFWEDRDIGLVTSQNAFNPSVLGVLVEPLARRSPDRCSSFVIFCQC